MTTEGPFNYGVYRWTKLSMVYTIVLGAGIVLLFPLVVGKPPGLEDFLFALGTFYSSMLYTGFYVSCLAVCDASAKIKAEFKVKFYLCILNNPGFIYLKIIIFIEAGSDTKNQPEEFSFRKRKIFQRFDFVISISLDGVGTCHARDGFVCLCFFFKCFGINIFFCRNVHLPFSW